MNLAIIYINSSDCDKNQKVDAMVLLFVVSMLHSTSELTGPTWQ